MMRLSLPLVFLIYAQAALAQELVFSTAAVDQCLATGQTEACIGLSSAACQQNTPGGDTTVGMIGCLDRELSYWDGALNYYYQDLRNQDPDRAEDLKQLQRSWIAYRDATCGYEAAEFQGGTFAGIAATDCHLRLTGRQTLYLRGVHTDLMQR